MEDWDVIKHPHLTEKSMDMVDRENKLTLVVDDRSNKDEIQDAVEGLFDVSVDKVNTLNRGNDKKAYVKLAPEHDAMDVATRLGML
ncbi:MAG: 50S ribosomal protein L23 [Candidatus Nanohaloarchaeota archaeon QJJ-7]|nr:50S ribosomal protein L23 [Candidatus Nanohaloarchaeota archaeon QJJ-7]